jgi:hypothetical protein
MCGIGLALGGKLGAPEFFQAIWPCLVPLLRLEDGFSISFGSAPKLLVQIDAVAAAPILLDPKVLSLDNPQLRHVIEALNESRIPIPREILLPLISQLEPLVETYPHDSQLAEALLAYARNPDAETESRLRGFLRSSSERLQAGGAKALATFYGIEGQHSKLCNLENEKGIDALTEAERHYFTASIYYYEIMNGGPWQYINNSTADYHFQIIEGLRAIGAHDTAQVLVELGKVFGPSGPSANRELRGDQADAFTQQQASAISRLYEAFPSAGENIEMLLDLYAATNAAKFPHCK